MSNCQLEKKDHEKIIQFVKSIQENSIDFKPRVIHYLSSILSFNHVTFFMTDEEGKFIDPIGININEKLFKLYFEYYYKTDIFHPNNYSSQFTSKENVVTVTDLMTYKNFENTEFYHFLKQDNFYYQTSLYLRKNNRLIGTIGIFKTKESGNFTKKDIDILNILTPFISIRLSDYMEVTQTKHDLHIYKNSMMQIPAGVVLLDNNYSVFSYNELALAYCNDILRFKKSVTDPVGEVIKNAFSNLCFQDKNSATFLYSPNNRYNLSIKPIIIPNSQKGIETYFIIYIYSSYSSENCTYYSNAVNYHLTKRELEIIELIDQGLNNKEISEKLYISYNTVRTHIENILKKMDVTNRTAILHKLK